MMEKLQKYRMAIFTVAILLSSSLVVYAQDMLKEAAKAAKVTPDLYRVMQNRGQVASVRVEEFTVETNQVFEGYRIAIEAVANNDEGEELLNQLKTLGLTEGVAYKRIVFGYLPISKIDELRNVPLLSFARSYYKPITNTGAVTSQGDASLRANTARTTFGVTGAGVKVGVLSDSYNNLGGAPAGVASNDLPAAGVQVLQDLASGGADEGRAMAEIVHDVAPGSAIAFNTAFTGQAGFAQGIINLAAAGCKIIVDDVFYFVEPFFQDGPIAQAITQVVNNNGVAYFSLAGNHGRSSYQAPYKSGGTYNGFPTHDFGSGAVDNRQRITIPAFSTFRLVLQWDNPFQSISGGVGATTDLDFYILSTSGTVIASAVANQSSGGDPVEFAGTLTNNSSSPGSVDLVIVKRSGPDPGLIKWVNLRNGSGVPTVEYDTRSSTLVGHSNLAEAISVGAAPFFNTPAFNSGLTTAVLEPFSSAGGTPILFTTSGTRINGITGTVLQKPEITAVDGGNNTFFGNDSSADPDAFPNFFGTSASAPHAAAVGALMKEKVPAITKSAILSTLQSTALDMDDPAFAGFETGFDFGTGFGFIQADRALQAIANTAPIATANANQTATVGVPFSYTVNAFTDAETPGSLAYTANIVPSNGFAFNPATRVITGTPSLSGVSSVTVVATDPGSLSASTTFTITVNPAPVVVTPLTLAVSATPPAILTTGTTTLSATVSGGTTPYSYTFSGPGTITPSGNTATVSGLSAGVQTFTVRVADATSPSSQTISATVSVTVSAVNTAPTVVNSIPPQSATVGQAFSYVIPANTFTDAETPNGLSLSASGLPGGLSLSGSTISGVPSTTLGSPFSVTITATDPSSLSASTSFALTVNPASVTVTPGAFAITGVTTVNCATVTAGKRTVTFTPQYAGLTGQPVSFSVVNELPATSSPGPYALDLYTDNPVITLEAVQVGTAGRASFVYDWLAACNSGSPSPTGFAIVGVTSVNCATVTAGERLLTFSPQYVGLTGQPVTFSVLNELSATTAPGPYSLRIYTDNPVITLEAVQTGTAGKASFVYNWLAACVGGARLGASMELQTKLDIRVLGNPINHDQMSVEVRGAEAQSLQLHLTDAQGKLLETRQVDKAALIETHTFEVGHRPVGLLLLRAITPTQVQMVKVIKSK